MDNSEATRRPAELELSHKWDKCISNMLIQSAAGFGVGSLLSLLVFKRRAWPIIAGTGFAAGSSFRDCQFDFTHEYPNVQKVKAASTPSPAASASPSSSS